VSPSAGHKNITVELPTVLLDKLKRRAESEHRSTTSEVRCAVEFYLANTQPGPRSKA
jgi:hypothetical protein